MLEKCRKMQKNELFVLQKQSSRFKELTKAYEQAYEHIGDWIQTGYRLFSKSLATLKLLSTHKNYQNI